MPDPSKGGSAPAETHQVAQRWKDLFDQFMAEEPTDFERQVLSDYIITDAEYQEARNRFITCMTDLGWKVSCDSRQCEFRAGAGSNKGPKNDLFECPTTPEQGALRLTFPSCPRSGS